jgi:hypothetical protein
MAWSILGLIPKVRIIISSCLVVHNPRHYYLFKALVAQMHRDQSIKRLIETMSDICKFVLESEPLKSIEDRTTVHKTIVEILAAMAAQTTECAYFIRSYVQTASFCESTAAISLLISHCTTIGSKAVKHSISDVDDQVQQYVDKFAELKSAFQGRVVLHVDITVLRILDKVEDLGEQISVTLADIFLMQWSCSH